MGIKWRQDSVKQLQEQRAASARSAALLSQMEAAVRVFAATASLNDNQALEMPDLFCSWEEVLQAGKKLAEGTIVRNGKVLYRVVQAGGVIPQEHQPPGGEGMLAVYRPIQQSHAGTPEDPIPWVYGMDCIAGTYYSYNGHTYKVADGGTMTPCVWPPDTAGMWQWVAD